MRKLIVCFALCFAACQTQTEKSQLDQYLAQYQPYDMHFDASGYNETDKTILKKLVQAAAYIDTVYWMQTSKYGLTLRRNLQAITDDPEAEKQLMLIKRNAGPFEMLADHKAFMGNQEYYPGDELYPRGMTVAEFDAYFETLSPEEQEKFMSPYTAIRGTGSGGYKAVPYHKEYEKWITPMVQLLNECADLTDNPGFAKYLRLKAEALTTDDYFEADVAWIDFERDKFDIVFGPFETYSDGIKGIKAKYEAYIEIVDQEESKNLEVYTQYLQQIEENLPIPEEYKSVVSGLTAKFVVVRDIMRAGEAAAGYQAVAANLPNDPRVHKEKGTVKTFWKNMFEARFNAIITPVSKKLIDESQLSYLSDDGFFQFVLMHEICHAIGPRTVKVGENKGKPVNAVIGPNYSPLEECKADVTGLHALAFLIDEGVVAADKEKNFYVSYLGSLFRSVRFGLHQAHAKAASMELNYLHDKGALVFDEDAVKWTVNFDKFREGIKLLAADILILEGDGISENVQAFFDKWGVLSPPLQASLEQVKDLPIDVLPQYSIKWD